MRYRSYKNWSFNNIFIFDIKEVVSEPCYCYMINDLTLSGVFKDQRYTGDLMIPQSLSFLVRSFYLLIYIVESLWLLCTNKYIQHHFQNL